MFPRRVLRTVFLSRLALRGQLLGYGIIMSMTLEDNLHLLDNLGRLPEDWMDDFGGRVKQEVLGDAREVIRAMGDLQPSITMQATVQLTWERGDDYIVLAVWPEHWVLSGSFPALADGTRVKRSVKHLVEYLEAVLLGSPFYPLVENISVDMVS